MARDRFPAKRMTNSTKQKPIAGAERAELANCRFAQGAQAARTGESHSAIGAHEHGLF
jgi:hypothetical protein